MMGSAAAFDMARQSQVASVTLADSDFKRAKAVAARVNTINGDKKVRAAELDAADEKSAAKLMRGHDAVLSAVPYFLNLGLAKAAIEARCHFADLGGNNTVVRQELALSAKAEKSGVAIAPDCGLSPGMASILGGELVNRLGGRADALRLYVGGLPERPVRSVSLPARVLGGGPHQRVRGACPHLAQRHAGHDRTPCRARGISHGRFPAPGRISDLGWHADPAGKLRGQGRRMF